MMNVNENKELKGNVEFKTLDNSLKAKVQAPFKEEFDKMLNDSNIDLSYMANAVTMQPSIEFDYSSLDIGTTVSIDTKKIENVDAMFFLNISNNSENINLQIGDATSVIDASNYRTMEVSKTLGDLIMKSAENNKALRLDFDNQVTVVLRVSKDGRIDTTFIPQDKEVENYLKNNIDYLKVRFDEQNIAYSNISYKPYKQNNGQENNNNDNNNKRQGDKNE